MGGNALKDFGTKRLPASSALKIGHLFCQTLIDAMPNQSSVPSPAIIRSYREKEDFGDIDILIPQSLAQEVSPERIAQLVGDTTDLLQPLAFRRNGPITSYGYPLESGGVFQVDLIVSPEYEFEFSVGYYAWNDAGNLIGRIAHKMGMKFGHDGLWLMMREGDNLFDEILVTRNFVEAIRYLGFDVDRWSKGFDTREDIYRFIVTGKYFDPEIFLLGNRNHQARVRDAKRPTYTGFLKWIEQHQVPANFSAWPANKSEWLPNLFAAFPTAKLDYEKSLATLARRKQVNARFNGEKVAAITGLSGKALGAHMAAFRNGFSSVEAFEEFVLTAPEQQLLTVLREVVVPNTVPDAGQIQH